MDNNSNQSISVCIPTYRRPELLRRVLRSILEADLKPYEVIIGDNGGGDAETKSVIKDYGVKLPIRYTVHNPPLNYAGNLQAILSQAQCDWIGVMHDDDYYLPGCGARLRAVIRTGNFDFFFSDHLICSNNGDILQNESVENSKAYNRSTLKSGVLQDSLGAVLRSQVCMDGWFAKRKLLQTVKTDLRWAEYFDTQYLVQFAMNSNKWFYESTPTFVYRLSSTSLTAAGLKVQELFDYYSNLNLTSDNHIELRDQLLREYAPVAVTRWLREGNKTKAITCLHSSYYPRPKSFRGIVKYITQLAWAYSPWRPYT